jgi:polyisoprenoid-binding protein YceI
MTFRLAATAVALALLAAPLSVAAADTGPASMTAGTYVIDPHHASLIASVSHLGRSTYVFRFDKFDASYDYDPAAPDAAKLTVSIDVNSLDTGWDQADKQFSRDFAGAARTPVARFVSTSITHSGNSGTVTGDLTLNGVTKPVSLAVTFNGYGPLGPMGVLGKKAGFSATGTIKRSDFGLTKDLPMVGDEISLQINAEFAPKK